ncbi:MAG TPA: type VI secretion system tube protein Hcp [Pirellulales bacterium]|jgi:type VI secretion system Hcp family effector|nr:type VI secretion system tube protein Hcp [Pirellulales bacterium]
MPSTFLQIADLPAAGAEDKGWIPVKNVSLGITTEVGKFERGKARQVNTSEHNDIEIKKPLDRASLFLDVACSDGRVLKSVGLAFSREGEKEIYLKVELKNVFVSEIGLDIADGEEPEETVKLNYESIVWKFRPKLKSGQMGNWVAAGWDRSELREITPS